MDLNSITDIKELKAMAFDQLAAKDLAESNLRALQNRIAQLQQAEAASKPKSK